MRTLSGTLTAAQKLPATRPHPKIEVYDKVAGVTRHHWERYYTGAEDLKHHAVTMPGDGSLVRLRTDAANQLYWQRVTTPGSGSTYSSWTDWGVTAYALSLCSYGATVVASRISVAGHLLIAISTDNGGTWSSWLDVETIAGVAANFTLASCFKDATNFLLLYTDGTDLYRKRLEIAESWVTPTGHNDPGGNWGDGVGYDEPQAYDDNTGPASFCRSMQSLHEAWTTFCEFTHADLLCDKLRYHVTNLGSEGNQAIDVDAYYGGAWHDVYEGYCTQASWVAKDIPAGHQTVTKMRVRIYPDWTGPIQGRITEVDFGSSITDEAGGIWTNAMTSISGVAVVYQGDYNIIVTGLDASADPCVCTFVLGDGYSAAPGNWSALVELMIAEAASAVTYSHPALAMPDVYRAWFVETFTGAVAYSRPYHTHGIASADFISSFWREPVPFNLASSYGLSLTHKSPGVWLTRADGVWYADLAAGTVELTDNVLTIKATARETTGEIAITLRNDDGRFDNIGDAADSYEQVKLGTELLYSPGFHTTAGGSPEHSTGLAYWIESFDYLSKGGRATLTIIATDGWGLLERWKARRQFTWAAGAKNVFQLLNFLHSKAGLEFSALGASSAVVTDLQPAFTINPGESGKTACLRLLAMIPDVLLFRGKYGYLKNILAGDTEDYEYGTDHAILEAHYQTRHKESNRIQATNGTILAEDFDWTEIDLVFDILEQDYDLALSSAARAAARAAAIQRRQVIGARDGYVLVPMNCGQEIYDVIKLTDQRAPLSAEKRRVLGIDHTYHPAKYQYRTLAHLGAV